MAADTEGKVDAGDEELDEEELVDETDDETADDDDFDDETDDETTDDDDFDDETDDETTDGETDDAAPEDEYEPGDVNTVRPSSKAGDVNAIGTKPSRGRSAASAGDDRRDDQGDDQGDDHDGDRGGDTSVEVLTYLARAMSDEPDAVVIRKEERRGSTVLRLHVAPRDMGRVIGRRGRTAQAIRTLVGVAGARDGEQTAVDIVDD